MYLIPYCILHDCTLFYILSSILSSPHMPPCHTCPPCHAPLCHAHPHHACPPPRTPPSATHAPLPPWTYPSQTSYSGGNKPIINEPAIIWFSVDNKIFLYVRRWHFKVNLLVYRWKVLEAACNTFRLAGRHLFFLFAANLFQIYWPIFLTKVLFTVNQTL